MKKNYISIFLMVIVFLVFFTLSGLANFIKVTTEVANISMMPNSESEIVGKALEGDIFKCLNDKDEWIEIEMFSSDSRYIHSSLVKVLTGGVSAPFSNDICPKLIERLEEAKEESLTESDVKSQNVLFDRYVLDIFHEFELQPVLYLIAVNRCIEGSGSKIGQRPTVSPKESEISKEKEEKSLVKEKHSKEIDNIPQIIRNNAKTKWGNNIEMVNYEVDQQMNAYNWYISEDRYSNILSNARSKWGNNFEMVKYEYEEQVSAYEWIDEYNNYPNIMSKAISKWGNNYTMVKYEYEEQVNAYKWLQKNKDKNPKAFNYAISKWSDNYVMVKYEFEEMNK